MDFDVERIQKLLEGIGLGPEPASRRAAELCALAGRDDPVAVEVRDLLARLDLDLELTAADTKLIQLRTTDQEELSTEALVAEIAALLDGARAHAERGDSAGHRRSSDVTLPQLDLPEP
ncbi:unnamed protein product, partial [marine sediment metagenome]